MFIVGHDLTKYIKLSLLTNFQVSILIGDVSNDMLILNGEVSSSVYKWNGKSCASMDTRGNRIEVKNVFDIMSALPVVDCITVHCSFCHIRVVVCTCRFWATFLRRMNSHHMT